MSAHERIGEVLLALLGNDAEIETSWQRDWASATFIGARHHYSIRTRLAQGDPVPEFARVAGDHEFEVAGQLVADVCVREADRQLGGVTVLVEVLTVEES